MHIRECLASATLHVCVCIYIPITCQHSHLCVYIHTYYMPTCKCVCIYTYLLASAAITSQLLIATSA
jgi:hypothetical protein